MRLTFIVALVAVCLTGCKGRKDVLKQYDLNAVLKMYVLKSGEVFADGNKVTLQELEPLIAANAQKRGVVWYYREAANQEPPPQATQVIDLVTKHKRPIRMSTSPDFSDAIGNQGSAAR